jgi:hypothetical protein
VKAYRRQVEGKRAVLKLQAAYLYKMYATPQPDKNNLRAIAEQAHAEWLTKQMRVTNLDDHLRKKY